MGNLIRNERLKLYKKISTWVLIGVVVLLVLASTGFIKFAEYLNSNMSGSWTYQDDYNMQIENARSQLSGTDDETEKLSLQNDLDRLTYLLKNEISPDEWRADAAQAYFNSLRDVKNRELELKNQNITDFSADKIWAEANKAAEEAKKVLDSKDWKLWIQKKITAVKNGDIPFDTEAEKNVELEILQLYLDYNIVPLSESNGDYYYNTSSTKSWQISELNTLKQNKLALLRGQTSNSMTGQSELLTSVNRQKIEHKIDESIMRLKTGTAPVDTSTLPGLFDVAVSSPENISLILIVLGGGIIASEFSSGTIKLLLITPHRRKKIFWAKASIMVEVTLITSAFLLVLGFLLCGALTGFKDVAAMQVITLFGATVRMPYLVFVLMKFVLGLLPVLCYGAMALMFSAVVRKTAVAIAIPMVLMFGSESLLAIVSMFSAGNPIPGLKFLFFANTNLAAYLPSSSMMGMDMGSVLGSTLVDKTMTLPFSVIVLVVYLFCFLFIAHDSFCRRDIK